MTDKEMYFMSYKWTRLEHKLFYKKVDAIGQQAGYCHP